jgi:hypothetical protein
MKMGPDAERRQRYLEVEKPPYKVVGPLERFNERDNVPRGGRRRVAVKGKWGARALLALEKSFNSGFEPEELPAWFEEPSREWLSDMRGIQAKKGG